TDDHAPQRLRRHPCRPAEERGNIRCADAESRFRQEPSDTRSLDDSSPVAACRNEQAWRMFTPYRRAVQCESGGAGPHARKPDILQSWIAPLQRGLESRACCSLVQFGFVTVERSNQQPSIRGASQRAAKPVRREQSPLGVATQGVKALA